MLSAHEPLCWVFCSNLELSGKPPHRAPSSFPSQYKQFFQIKQHTEHWPALQKLSWDVKLGRLLVIQSGWQNGEEGGWHVEYLEGWVCCLHVHSVVCPPHSLIFCKCYPPGSPAASSGFTSYYLWNTSLFRGNGLFCSVLWWHFYECAILRRKAAVSAQCIVPKLSNRGGLS